MIMNQLENKNRELADENEKLKRQIRALKLRKKVWLGLGRRKRARTDCFELTE